MKKHLLILLMSAVSLSVIGREAWAQTGNDNLTGPAGILNGNITTAGNYDPYTGNVMRAVTDMTVAGTAGAIPLTLTRFYNSRGPLGTQFGTTCWHHNYEWSMADSTATTSQTYMPPSYTVYFPDGRAMVFSDVSTDTDPYYRAGTGVQERFIPFNWTGNLLGYLVQADGSKVEFKATQYSYRDQCCPQDGCSVCTFYYYKFAVQALVDPYGQRTTLTYNQYGLRVTEPAGRALQFVMGTAFGGQVVDHVTSTDGRTVQYSYVNNPVTGATTGFSRLDSVTYFGDNTLVAHYGYAKPNVGSANGLPLLSTCVDPMYAGPMWNIAYVYATGINADGTTAAVYGQIKSENYFWNNSVGVAVSTLAVNNTAQTRTETRGDGPARTFQYTGSLLWRCTDFKGVWASQNFDANKYINLIIDRNGKQTDYTRDALTAATKQVKFPATPTDAPNVRGTLNATYSGDPACSGLNNGDATNPYYVCTQTDEANHITKYTRIGGAGINKMRISRIDYPDGEYQTFSYDLYGNVITHRLTTGGVESYAYYYSAPNGNDAAYLNGLPKEYRDPYHATGNPTARYQYNGLSRLYSITDALGTSTSDTNHTTTYTYNTRGQTLYITDPNDPNDGSQHFIQNVYNPNGTLATTTDELSHTTSYSYDAYKRIYTTTSPVRGNGDNSVNTTQYNYDPWNTAGPASLTANTPTIITSPAGMLTWNTYDQNLRRTHLEVAPNSADQADTWFTYDNVGNLTQVQDPLTHLTKTTYDERNRPYKVTDALNHDTIAHYDAGGHKDKVTRPNNQIITYDSYDTMNRLLQKTVSQSPNPAAIIIYTYDPSGGLLLTMKDPNTNMYTYGYDLMNRKTSLTYPGGTTETWTYDNTGGSTPAGNGLLYQFKNRAGNMETFIYDNLGRATLMDWNDGLTPDVTVGYDAASRVTSITNANSTINRAYYNDNLLNSESNKYGDNITRTVTYSYDQDGRRATLGYPNNAYSFTYGYTGRSQLQTIQSGTNNVATYGYDANGNMISRTLDNDTSSTFTYNDPLNRCTSISHALIGTTKTFDYGYDVPKVGNLGWVKRDGNLGDAYDYDLNDQALAVKLNIANPDAAGAAGSQTISYDAAGNRTTFSAYAQTDTYVSNALNQYSTRNGTSAAYDGNGNMTTGFDGSTYTYDAQNRLLTATKGSTTDTFVYDGLNRQIGKKIGSQAWYYRVYDGWDLLGEYKTGVNNATFAYLYGTGGIVKNVVTNNYYYQDKMGSTSHAANASGTLKEYYLYDLHGQPTFYNAAGTKLSDTAIGVRHLFTGQQWYNEIGLYDLRNRYYSSDMGRFLQGDPIGFGGDGSNLYRYCANNPSSLADPAGLYFIYDDLAFMLGGGIAGVGSQALSDLSSGHWGSKSDYLAAFLGGAASGETLLYIPNPVVSGAVGGFVTNGLKQAFDMRSGKQPGGFDYFQLTVQTFVGGATGTFGKGGLRITRFARTNKWNGLYLQMVTKWKSGTARHIRPRTAGKMFGGRFYNSGGAHGAVATGIFNGFPSFGGRPSSGQAPPGSGTTTGTDASPGEVPSTDAGSPDSSGQDTSSYNDGFDPGDDSFPVDFGLSPTDDIGPGPYDMDLDPSMDWGDDGGGGGGLPIDLPVLRQE